MIEKLYPGLAIDRVQDISLEILKKNNIKGIILDIDNTLVPTHTREPDEKCMEWIVRMKEAGIGLCIVSNASLQRVTKFNEKLSLHTIHRAYKPSTEAFHKGAALMGIESRNVAVVGDQIFTDVYGGNKAGMLTILVNPLHKKEFFFVRMKRIPEKYVLASYKKNRGGR